ncbi:probable proline--tRNA ligase, mitochondrial isoform X1 [Ornithodoros turicata]|uniref:probable proline--tRNA ligase, mitochondrial isoform X1 n=1 Tax=Ornithodoros turicata TaxID=34597 RepID=UPI00313A3830
MFKGVSLHFNCTLLNSRSITLRLMSYPARCCAKKNLSNIARTSQLLQPSVFAGTATKPTKQDGVCKSQRMMMDYGLIAPASTGTIILLPLAMRALQKLVNIIDAEMKRIGGQKLSLPCLIPADLMKKTGRWEKMEQELLKLHDRRDHNYCLGPTHEETISHMISTLPPMLRSSYPLLLYQIGTKFRDEARPKFGLMRAKEFLMKDMYTFDENDASAHGTYEKVCAAYDKIFRHLGVPYVKVQASTGAMGGSYSHEYHFVSDIGEDKLHLCSKCNRGINAEEDNEDAEQTWKCTHCVGPFRHERGIEVGHAFSLGTAYSKPLKAECLGDDGKQRPLLMNCFGIGVTRLLAACLELLSTADRLRWPAAIAPYTVAIVTPKKGSHEEAAVGNLPEHLSRHLNSLPRLLGDVVLDDRNSWTVGRRLRDLYNIGIPYVVVAGKKIKEDVPRFELHDVYSQTSVDLTHSEVIGYFEMKKCTEGL